VKCDERYHNGLPPVVVYLCPTQPARTGTLFYLTNTAGDFKSSFYLIELNDH
jgi:hypothetical protein